MTALGPFIWELDFSVADKLEFPLTNWNNIQRYVLCHPSRHVWHQSPGKKAETRPQIAQGCDEVECRMRQETQSSHLGREGLRT